MAHKHKIQYRLKAYRDGREAQRSLAQYFAFYNTRRRHQGLDGVAPDQLYFTETSLPRAA